MKIEEKLKNLKSEIPAVPEHLKESVMSSIKLKPEANSKVLVLPTILKLMPAFFMIVLILVVAFAYPNKNNYKSFVIDESLGDLSEEKQFFIEYRISIPKNKINKNEIIDLTVEFGSSNNVKEDILEDLLITIESSDFLVVNKETFLIEDFNQPSYVVNNNEFLYYVTFKIKLNENVNEGGSLSVLFNNFTVNEEDKDDYFSSLIKIIEFEIIDNEIIFKEGER